MQAAASVGGPMVGLEMSLPCLPANMQKCDKCKLEKDDCIQIFKPKEGTSQAGVWRCKPCNALVSRLTTVKKNDDMALLFDDISADSKAKFFQNNHALMGSDLTAVLHDTVVASLLQRRELEHAAEGDWLDEVDIKDKYKSKPALAQVILKNAKSWYDEQKETWLYLDIKYKTNSRAIDISERKREFKAAQESKAKKARVAKPMAKADNKVADGEAAADDKKSLTSADKTQCTKLVADLQAKSSLVQQKITICEHEKLKDMIPTYVVRNLKLWMAEAIQWTTEAQVILEEEKADKFKEFKKAGADVKKKVNPTLTKAAKQIDDAFAEIEYYIDFSEDGSSWELKPVEEEA